MPITPPLTKPLPMLSSFVCWILILPLSVFVIATASLSLTTPSLAISLTVASASCAVSAYGYLMTRKLYFCAMTLPYSAEGTDVGKWPPSSTSDVIVEGPAAASPPPHGMTVRQSAG